MTTIKEGTRTTASETATARGVDMKFEIVVIPVSDVDRAKRFYDGNGWRFQEVTERLAEVGVATDTTYPPSTWLPAAFRRAVAGDGEPEKGPGGYDGSGRAWFGGCVVGEGAGKPLPS